MALCIMYVHDCGRRFNVYFPKALIFGELRGDKSTDWEAIDREEEAAGEIELVKNSAVVSGTSFIDMRKTQLTICQCGQVIDFKKLIPPNDKKQ